MFAWFSNYLSDRKQFTFVNEIASDVRGVHYGVPQGSVLDPKVQSMPHLLTS